MTATNQMGMPGCFRLLLVGCGIFNSMAIPMVPQTPASADLVVLSDKDAQAPSFRDWVNPFREPSA